MPGAVAVVVVGVGVATVVVGKVAVVAAGNVCSVFCAGCMIVETAGESVIWASVFVWVTTLLSKAVSPVDESPLLHAVNRKLPIIATDNIFLIISLFFA